jgi:hypothetical protein
MECSEENENIDLIGAEWEMMRGKVTPRIT